MSRTSDAVLAAIEAGRPVPVTRWHPRWMRAGSTACSFDPAAEAEIDEDEAYQRFAALDAVVSAGGCSVAAWRAALDDWTEAARARAERAR